MPIYDFRCPDGHTFDHYCRVADRNKPVTCECGKSANRIMSLPHFHLNGTDPGFPTAYDKWADMHEKEARKPENPNLKHI